MLKTSKLMFAAVCALGFGLAFASSASANGCLSCWNNCQTELEACIGDPNNNAYWCHITFNNCAIGCGCEIP